MKPADLRSHRDARDGGGLKSLYRPAEVAKVLRCSEWWVKEQARNGRIPFSWIGGSYRFTDGHVAEIIRLFERRPANSEPVTDRSTEPKPQPKRPKGTEPTVMLKARTPRRALRGITQPSAAA